MEECEAEWAITSEAIVDYVYRVSDSKIEESRLLGAQNKHAPDQARRGIKFSLFCFDLRRVVSNGFGLD